MLNFEIRIREGGSEVNPHCGTFRKPTLWHKLDDDVRESWLLTYSQMHYHCSKAKPVLECIYEC
jgi:hypothetical protein